jgi:flagellin-like hook-associated protein FlgL
MAITLNAYTSGLSAQRALSKSSQAASTAMTRLSTGLRINSAADDPAGLNLSALLSSDARIFAQGIRNLNDGISLFTVAESAVDALTQLSSRLSELAETASSGTLSHSQRTALSRESDALVDEYNRIITTTSFNGQKLLDGSMRQITFQAGSDALALSLDITRFNHGTGAFTASSSGTYNVGGNGSSMELADLNGDGVLDMLTANGADQTYSILIGNGDGSFKAATEYSLGYNIYEAKAVDVNNDGKLDIVATSDTSGKLLVSLGDGNGSFLLTRTINTSTGSPSNMSFGDANNDGNQDVAVSDASGNLEVYLGNGSGGFSYKSTQADSSGNSAAQNAFYDFNGDGILDLVYTAESLAVLRGNGDGTFAAISGANTLSANGEAKFAIGDFNGDGRDDIAAVDGGTATSVDIYFSDGDGTFTAGSTIAYALRVTSLSSEDLNGDGYADLVAGYVGVGNALAVTLANSDGTFGALTSYTGAVTNVGYLRAVSIADLNADGAYDLVATEGLNNAYNTYLGVFDQSSSGSETGMEEIDISTVYGARQALVTLRTNITSLTQVSGKLGAISSRLAVATDNLEATRANYEQAVSRIVDADVAAEAANLLRSQILMQAAAAILAQNNQQGELALQLLQ